MKIRTHGLVFLLSLGLPAMLGAAGVKVGPFAVAEAQAQQPDAVTALARERFLEGVTAYDQGRYEDARSLFLQAYALKRHPAVLLNLGQSELKSGHVDEGGNHLQQFLREHASATEEQREAARRGIADARARTGHVVVIVDVDGAQVAIDGVPAGQSPLLDPVFVKPGEHTVSATMSGKTVTAKAMAKRGSATPVSLSLQSVGVVPAPAPVPTPVPTPTTAPAPTGAPTSPAPAPTPVAEPTQTAPPPYLPPLPPTEPRRTQGREGFFDWYTHKPIAWALTGLAGLGLVGTIGFGAAAGNADSSATENTDTILAEVDRWKDDPTAAGYLPPQYYDNGDPNTGQPQPCGERDQPETAASYYAGACNTLRDNLNSYDTDIALMTVSIIVMAGSIGGTVIYYFVDADDAPPEDAAAPAGGAVAIGPIITPTTQGLGLLGTF